MTNAVCMPTKLASREGNEATNKSSSDNNNSQKKDKPHDDGQRYQHNNEKEEKNLDSGYAWLILAVMFLLASSTGGTNRVYGLIYAKQVAIGYYDHEQASWPIATASTVENLAGLMTPALAQFLSWRQIELLATLLFVVANVGAYFSDSLAVDILCLGLIQGLALSINTVLGLVINNDYFRRYRTTAYGISLSGSTFGIIYLGPLVSWCLENDPMEFRSGYLVIGGVLALNAILVIFIKPRNDKSTAPSTASGQAEIQQQRQQQQQQRQHQQHQLEDQASSNIKGVAAERKRSLLERHLERKNSVASIALMCKQKRQSDLQRKPTIRSLASQDSRKPVYSSSTCKGIPTIARQLIAAERDHERGELKKSASSSEFSSTTIGSGATLEFVALDRNKQRQPVHKLSLFSPPSSSPPPPTTTPTPTTPSQVSAASHQMETGRYHANMMITATAAAAAPFNGQEKPGLSTSVASLSARSSVSSVATTTMGAAAEFSLDDREDINKVMRRRKSGTANDDDDDDDDINQAKANISKELLEEEAESLSVELVGALLRSPYLHCVWIMLSLYYLIARIFIIILVDLAKDNGLSSSESRSLLNYWSIGEIVGRIVLCSFVDLQWLSVRACIMLTCSSMSVCIGLMALLAGEGGGNNADSVFYLYASCSALVAALISLEYVLINVLMIEYLGQSRVTSCYSLGSLISSLVLLGRPALIGLFRDHLGSYNGLLLLLAGLSLSFGLLFGLMEPLFVRYWPKRQLLHRSQLVR